MPCHKAECKCTFPCIKQPNPRQKRRGFGFVAIHSGNRSLEREHRAEEAVAVFDRTPAAGGEALAAFDVDDAVVAPAREGL